MPLNLNGNIIHSSDVTSSGVFTLKLNRDSLMCFLDAADIDSYSGSGTTWTDMTGNYNGTLKSGSSFDAGNSGSIAFASASKQCVAIGNMGTFYGKGTISLWINPSTMANYNNAFATKFEGGNAGIRFEEDATGKFSVAIGNDAATFTAYNYTGSGMAINNWYNVALTWDTASNNAIGYFNGALVFNTNHTYWATTLPSVTIGNGFDATRYWNGKVAIFQMYNRMLSSYEIAENYQSQRVRFGL